MDKPVCVDLYCGLALRKSHFGAGANLPIQKFMAGRAENPKHVPFQGGGNSPHPISLMFRLVRNLKYPALPARFALERNIWIPSPKSIKNGVLRRALRVIELQLNRMPARPGSPQFSRRIATAIIAAVTAITVGISDLEMRPAFFTFASAFGYISLLAAPQSPTSGLTTCRTIKAIRPISFEAEATHGTE